MDTGILYEPPVAIPMGKEGFVIVNADVFDIRIFSIVSGAQALLFTVTNVSILEQSEDRRRFRSLERITLKPDFTSP